MNTNLLKIVKQIIADYGEEPFTNPKRLKAFFSDFAKDEPKPLRTAFGRCIEASAYNALKSAKDAAERVARKATIAQRVRDEHGLDTAFCAEALDILEAALFGTASPAPKTIFCPSCGAKLPGGSRFCPSCGAAVASGTTQKIWRELQTLKGHSSKGHWPEVLKFLMGFGGISVAYSPDGSRIVSGSGDNTIKIWDARSGHELHTLKGHTGRVRSVAYSPDGSRIVSGSGDNTIKIWDAGSGRELDTFKGHTGGVESVAYSPDGSRIVSGSDDKTIKIWDAETGWRILWTGGGHELQSLEGHTSWVRSVVYSPDGSRIVSGSSDDTIKIWGAD